MPDRARESGETAALSGAERSGAGPVALAPVRVEVHRSLDALPEPVEAFFAAAAEQHGFFESLAWFRIALANAGGAGEMPRLYVAASGGRIAAALLLREREPAGWLRPRLLASPSQGMDAAVFAPLLDPALGERGLDAIIAAIFRAVPHFHVVRFDCLGRDRPESAALAAALRRQHLLTRSFEDLYAGHHEDVRGLTIERFLDRRTPEMRDFVRAQVRTLEQGGKCRFAVIGGGPGLKAALVDYALVDLQSWKEEEPHPGCTASLIDYAAGAGLLRLGLLYVDDEPAAAQIWIVAGGRATIWRNRYARKFTRLSVGTVLTFEMIRRALATETLSEIEFAPSDDKGPRDWLGGERARFGLIVFNPWTLKGWIAAFRHAGRFWIMLAREALRAVRQALRPE